MAMLMMSASDLNKQASAHSGKVGLLGKGTFQKTSSSPVIWKLMENPHTFREEAGCRKGTLT